MISVTLNATPSYIALFFYTFPNICRYILLVSFSPLYFCNTNRNHEYLCETHMYSYICKYASVTIVQVQRRFKFEYLILLRSNLVNCHCDHSHERKSTYNILQHNSRLTCSISLLWRAFDLIGGTGFLQLNDATMNEWNWTWFFVVPCIISRWQQ